MTHPLATAAARLTRLLDPSLREALPPEAIEELDYRLARLAVRIADFRAARPHSQETLALPESKAHD